MNTELKSLVHVKRDEDELIDALTEVAHAHGFVWNGQVRNGEVRTYKLFKYLVETHPEVQEALENL